MRGEKNWGIIFLILIISGCGITPATESGDMGFSVVGKGEAIQGQETVRLADLSVDRQQVEQILAACDNLSMREDIQLRIPERVGEVYCFTAVRPENPDMQDYYDGFMELYGEFFPGRELNEEFLYYMGGSSEVIRDDSGKIIRDLYRVKDWKKKILSGKEKGIWFIYDESWHRVITEWEDCVCLEMGCPVGYGYTVLNKGKTLELSGTKISDYGSDTERYPGLEGYDPSDYLDYVGTYHRDSTVSFRLADREVPICEAVEYFEEYINGLPYPKDANAKTVVLDVDVYHVTGEIYGYNLITTKQYQGVDNDQMKPGTYDFILSDYAPLGGYAFMVESKDVDSLYGYYRIFFEHTYGIGYVLEAAEFHYPFQQVATFILILAGCITLGMVFTVFVGDFILEKERPKIREKIKMLLYEKAKVLDLECYDNPEYYDSLVLAISEVDKQIDRCVTFLQNTASGITVFISTGIYFLMKDKVSILFVVVSFIMTFCFNQLYNKLSFKIRMERVSSERKREYIKRVFYLGDYAKELRLNPEVSDILFKRFEEANDGVYQVEKKHANRRFFLSYMRRHVSNNIFSDVIYISYLVFQAAVQKALSFSSVAILYNSFGRLKQGMRVFTDVYPFACETSLYVQKIRDFLDYEPKIKSMEGRLPEPGAQQIDMEHVTFAYNEKDGDLLQDISLHIKPGQKIALVGYNGAGKTTLVKLLMRLYDVKEGRILSNGVDIRELDVEQYRNSIGTVFQDFKIFAGNVRENVLMDCEDPSKDGEITQALKDSGMWERVEAMPGGLETQLTTEIMERGVNLSGGESQKLAISRVFYQKAGLMILDEPSSALDPIAEYQLNHAMLSATKDKTVIFISHRLSTTRLADHIIMLEKGRVVERGTHEQLLQQNGKYARMWRVQAGAYIQV